jgi:microcystin-dependent protein
MTQTPVSTLQPALTLTEFVDTSGVFPPRGSGGSGPFLGSIGIFAGPSFLFSAPAQGQIYAIASNTALFSILGTDFGGNGTSDFELPNLGGVETFGAGQGPGLPAVNLGQSLGQTSYELTQAQLPPSFGGTSAAIDTQQPALGLNYVINTEGVFPSGGLTPNSLGVIPAFTGNVAPGNELLCDGQVLPISQFQALFALIGTTYGGDGVTTFALGPAGPRHRRRRRRFYARRAGRRRQRESNQRQFAAGPRRAGEHSAARSRDELLYRAARNISCGGRDRR